MNNPDPASSLVCLPFWAPALTQLPLQNATSLSRTQRFEVDVRDYDWSKNKLGISPFITFLWQLCLQVSPFVIVSACLLNVVKSNLEWDLNDFDQSLHSRCVAMFLPLYMLTRCLAAFTKICCYRCCWFEFPRFKLVMLYIVTKTPIFGFFQISSEPLGHESNSYFCLVGKLVKLLSPKNNLCMFIRRGSLFNGP